MIFFSKIRKIGNSKCFIIPKLIIEALNLKENDEVEVIVEENGIRINKKIIKD